MSIARRLAALGFGRQLYTFTGGILFTRASAGWRFNNAGLLVSEASDVPRFQYDPATLAARGLLVEDAATNVVRNSAAGGSVPGTPGTDPTNWGVATNSGGVTKQLLGFATEDGIPCIDYRFSGTPTTTNGVGIFAEPLSALSASLGQTYAGGWYLKRIAGDYTNIVAGGIVHYISERDAGGAHLVSTSALIVPTTGALRTQRSVLARTMANPSVARVSSSLAINYTNGAPIDITLRVGGPSLVQAGSAMSPIITTGTATTRAADVALLTNPAILGDQCVILKARTPRKISGGAVNVLWHRDDGTNNNNCRIVYGTDGRIHVIATSGGVDQCDLDLGAVANDTDFGVAARFAQNNFAASLNGAAVVTDSLGTNPTGLTTDRLGRRSDGYAWNSTILSYESRRQGGDGDLRAAAA